MKHEIPNPSIEEEVDKTAEQVLTDLVGKDADAFVQEVVDSMKRFQGRASSIVREAVYNLPESVKLKDEHLVGGNKISTLELLSRVVGNFLESNK